MLIVRIKKITSEVSMPIIFLLMLCLVFFVYFYHIQKPLPSGVDATNYIPSAQWIEKTGQAPDTYQPIQLGRFAYTSPFPSLILALLNIFLNIDFVFPLFSAFQVLALLLLCCTTYLVGALYHKYVGILACLFIAISVGYAFLFTSSTVANLLGLSFVNVIFYLLAQLYRQKNKWGIIILIGIFILALFFIHRQLTFPLFLTVFALYWFLFALKHKKKIKLYLQQITNYNKIHKIKSFFIYFCASVILLFICYKLYIYLNEIIAEWIKAYVGEYRYNRFGPKITVNGWWSYLGPFYSIFSLAGIGIIIYTKIKKAAQYYYMFAIIWVAFSLLLSLINYFGLSFETPRWLYQSYIFLSFFSGIALFEIFKKFFRHNRLMLILGITLLITSIFINGVMLNKRYSDTSNSVINDDIRAYKYLYDQTNYGENVFSNNNQFFLSGHDQMLLNMERHIDYNLEAVINNNIDLKEYLQLKKIEYIIIRQGKRNITKYLNQQPYLEKTYSNKTVAIYKKL